MMNYYVKELADKSAVLMAEDGYELATFPTVTLAVNACYRDCLVKPLWVEHYYDFADELYGQETGLVIDDEDWHDDSSLH